MSNTNLAESHFSQENFRENESFERSKALDLFTSVSEEMRLIYELDLRQILDITKDFDTFDRNRFRDMLKLCIHSVEKHTKTPTGFTKYSPEESPDGQPVDFREIGYELYVWLVDILTSIHVALKENDDKFLKESISRVHGEIETFMYIGEAELIES